jgi:hypothetical protein
MPAQLRLIWSAPERAETPREPRVPSPAEAEARALVDAWVSTPFESSIVALEDLVVQISLALARRNARLVVTACPASVHDTPCDTPDDR